MSNSAPGPSNDEHTSAGRLRQHVLEEYAALSELEQATTQMRHTTFTALISISFVLTGLAFGGEATEPIELPGDRTVTSSQIAAAFGFMFYCFTVIHYAWYHRYSHRYRDQLKQLELELDFKVYRNRRRPTYRRAKFHFDWTLYIIGIIYFIAIGVYSGWYLVIGLALFAVLVYCMFLLWSVWWDEEPLEDHGGGQ